MANFNEAFKLTSKYEGGYVNDRDDNGGETYLGISRKFNPNSKLWHIVDTYKKGYKGNKLTQYLNAVLSKDKEVNNIIEKLYKDKYWDVMRLDEVNNQLLANQLFDAAVNSGVSAAIKIAQHIVGMTITGIFNNELFKNLQNES